MSLKQKHNILDSIKGLIRYKYCNNEYNDLMKIYNKAIGCSKDDIDEISKQYVNYFGKMVSMFKEEESPIVRKEQQQLYELYLYIKTPLLKKYKKWNMSMLPLVDYEEVVTELYNRFGENEKYILDLLWQQCNDMEDDTKTDGKLLLLCRKLNEKRITKSVNKNGLH